MRRFFAVLGVTREGRCSEFLAKAHRNAEFSKYFFTIIAFPGYFWSPTWFVLADFGLPNGNRNSVIAGLKLSPEINYIFMFLQLVLGSILGSILGFKKDSNLV